MSSPSDHLREIYELRAELEYARPLAPPDPRVDRKFEVVWGAVVAALPCERFLDAGCGDGRHLAALGSLPERPIRIVGTDIASRILETAAAAARGAGIEPELVQANLERLPFEDAAFDVVLCTQVIEHLLDPPAGIRELARVLAPAGTLVLSTDSGRAIVSGVLNAPRAAVVTTLGFSGQRLRVRFPHRTFRKAELLELVSSAGLEVHRAKTFRFHLTGAGASVQRLLNAVDRRLPSHGVGDLLLIVAEKPR